MKITVNGEERDCREGQSLSSWLSEQNYDIRKIAVEVNERIVPKAEYEGYVLAEHDMLEVVTFVGGG